MRPQKKTFVEEKRNIEVDDNAKEENIETNSNVEESDRRWATFGQGSDLFCDYWGLPPTMTDKDSDNPITDNEEPSLKLYLWSKILRQGENDWNRGY